MSFPVEVTKTSLLRPLRALAVQMPTVDESNNSAAVTLHPHYTDGHTTAEYSSTALA